MRGGGGTKGSNFQSLSGMGIYSTVQIMGRGSNITVLKGVPACLERVVKLPLPRIGVP